MSFPAHLAELESRLRARFEAALDELRGQYESRLRQASDELVAAVGRVTPSADPLDQLELSDLDLAAPGRDRGSALLDLLEAFRALDRAATQAEALDSLLAGAQRFAARSGLLLVRSQGVSGWGSAGFDADPFAGRELAWNDDLLSRLASGRGTVKLGSADARRFAERLGIAHAGEAAVLIPMVLRDRVAAALYADASGAARLEVEALQLLVLAAASRIELQALTSRGFTPTLYDAEAAPGAGLELWTGVPATPAAAEPEAAAAPPPAPEPSSEPAVAGLPEAAVAEPEPEPEPEPEAATAEPEDGSSVETLFLATESEPEPEAEAWGAEGATIEAEPETDAGAAGFEIDSEAERAELDDSFWGTGAEAVPAEPEIEVAPDTATDDGAAIEPEPEPVAPLGEATVRIPTYRPEQEAAAEPPELEAAEPETPVEETPEAPAATGTREIPRFEPEAPTAEEDETVLITRPPAVEPTEAPTAAHDVTEDATVLTRRADVEPAPPAEEPGEDTVERTASRPARSTEVAPPPDVRGPGLAFGAARAGAPTGGENALHDEARRLARLLVSEIKLYNEEQVLEGRRNKDLYIRLREDIDRSRQIYDERVHDSVRAETDYFHQELVRSLAGGDSRALGM